MPRTNLRQVNAHKYLENAASSSHEDNIFGEELWMDFTGAPGASAFEKVVTNNLKVLFRQNIQIHDLLRDINQRFLVGMERPSSRESTSTSSSSDESVVEQRYVPGNQLLGQERWNATWQEHRGFKPDIKGVQNIGKNLKLFDLSYQPGASCMGNGFQTPLYPEPTPPCCQPFYAGVSEPVAPSFTLGYPQTNMTYMPGNDVPYYNSPWNDGRTLATPQSMIARMPLEEPDPNSRPLQPLSNATLDLQGAIESSKSPCQPSDSYRTVGKRKHSIMAYEPDNAVLNPTPSQNNLPKPPDSC